jgi:hypothetical protein
MTLAPAVSCKDGHRCVYRCMNPLAAAKEGVWYNVKSEQSVHVDVYDSRDVIGFCQRISSSSTVLRVESCSLQDRVHPLLYPARNIRCI